MLLFGQTICKIIFPCCGVLLIILTYHSRKNEAKFCLCELLCVCMGVCGSTQESGCMLAIVSERMSLCQGLSKYVNARVFKCKSLAWKSEVVRLWEWKRERKKANRCQTFERSCSNGSEFGKLNRDLIEIRIFLKPKLGSNFETAPKKFPSFISTEKNLVIS